MTMKQFYLIIRDKEKRTFSIEGPMEDDTRWNHAVVEATEQGREIMCFSLFDLEKIDELIQRETREGNRQVEPGSIVNPH